MEFGGAEKYGEWNIKVMISPNPPRKAGTVSLYLKKYISIYYAKDIILENNIIYSSCNIVKNWVYKSRRKSRIEQVKIQSLPVPWVVPVEPWIKIGGSAWHRIPKVKVAPSRFLHCTTDNIPKSTLLVGRFWLSGWPSTKKNKRKEQSRSSHVPVFLNAVVESTGFAWGWGQWPWMSHSTFHWFDHIPVPTLQSHAP